MKISMGVRGSGAQGSKTRSSIYMYQTEIHVQFITSIFLYLNYTHLKHKTELIVYPNLPLKLLLRDLYKLCHTV